MIPIQQMLQFFSTFEDEKTCPTVEAILSRWPADANSWRFLRVSSNFVFTFRIAQQPHILRFCPADHKPAAVIGEELAWLRHLIDQGIAANRPVAGQGGQWVETVSTAIGDFNAVVFNAVSGAELEELDQLTPPQFFAWGQALARLHTASAGFTGASRPNWQSLLQEAGRRLPTDHKLAHHHLQGVCAELSALPVNPQNYGLIHFDFELDNLIWQDDAPTAIDFDDCALHWYAADIAFALRDLWDDRASRVNLNHPHLVEFISGYRSLRPLAEEEVQRLPLLMRFQNLVKYAEIHQHLQDPLAADYPGWAQKIRQRLTTLADGYEQDFALW